MPRPFPREFREDVVRVARSRDPETTIEQVAKDFGIHPNTLVTWLRKSDGRRATTLVLRDELPRPPFRVPSTRLTITSDPQRLLARDFGSDVAEEINTTGAKGHGRTLTCLSDRGEPLAAISYHLPRGTDTPLLVTVIAVLDDRTARNHSIACAGILLCYLAHAAEHQHNDRPARLGMAPPPTSKAFATKLGFAPAGAPSEYATQRVRYMEWRAP